MRARRAPQHADQKLAEQSRAGFAFVSSRNTALQAALVIDLGHDAARRMQLRVAMMKTVKHTIYSIGDRSSDIARTIGSETADLAKRFGSNTASLARQIGPKRGLIGLAVLAAAVGGT